MSIYAVGDIHGCRKKLQYAITFLKENVGIADKVVFLGDYIDRGEDSKGCIDDLIEYSLDFPKPIFLRGNHEQMLLDSIFNDKSGEFGFWLRNGGLRTLESYGLDTGNIGTDCTIIPGSHADFIKSTRMDYFQDGFAFVHAGFLPDGCLWKERSRDAKLWIREDFENSEQDFEGFVIYGHTPQPDNEVWPMDNKMGIDTGAVFGGPLTVVKLDGVKKNDAGVLQFGVYRFFNSGLGG